MPARRTYRVLVSRKSPITLHPALPFPQPIPASDHPIRSPRPDLIPPNINAEPLRRHRLPPYQPRQPPPRKSQIPHAASIAHPLRHNQIRAVPTPQHLRYPRAALLRRPIFIPWIHKPRRIPPRPCRPRRRRPISIRCRRYRKRRHRPSLPVPVVQANPPPERPHRQQPIPANTHRANDPPRAHLPAPSPHARPHPAHGALPGPLEVEQRDRVRGAGEELRRGKKAEAVRRGEGVRGWVDEGVRRHGGGGGGGRGEGGEQADGEVRGGGEVEGGVEGFGREGVGRVEGGGVDGFWVVVGGVRGQGLRGGGVGEEVGGEDEGREGLGGGGGEEGGSVGGPGIAFRFFFWVGLRVERREIRTIGRF